MDRFFWFVFFFLILCFRIWNLMFQDLYWLWKWPKPGFWRIPLEEPLEFSFNKTLRFTERWLQMWHGIKVKGQVSKSRFKSKLHHKELLNFGQRTQSLGSSVFSLLTWSNSKTCFKVSLDLNYIRQRKQNIQCSAWHTVDLSSSVVTTIIIILVL